LQLPVGFEDLDYMLFLYWASNS